MDNQKTYSLQQIAQLYGYQYQTIRLLVCKRELRTVIDPYGRKHVTAAAMDEYLRKRLRRVRPKTVRLETATPCN